MSAVVTQAVGVAGSLVLVAVAIALSAAQRLGLERSMLWASVRAIVQLVLVGLALGVVLASQISLALAGVWILAMVGMAAWTVRNRAPEVPGAFSLSLVAFAASATVSLGVLFGLGTFSLTARNLVPLAGMVIGNSMTATVVAGRRMVEALADGRAEIEARLALGLTPRAASAPSLRRSVQLAMVPQIEATKAVGLIFLPGAMTGLILGGADPMRAVLVQAAIMYMILGATATTTAVVAVGLQRRLFTADARLAPLRRREP